MVVKQNAPLRLFEVAPGSNDIIPKVMAKLFEHPETAYVSANVDKKLTASFKKKTADLPLKIEVIEDIAQNLEQYIKDELFDVVVFEHSVKDMFLGLVQVCMSILKPGGFIVINHFMYENDLKRGINPELWENLLPIVREWIITLESGIEIDVMGFDKQWWMFLQKKTV